MDASQWITIVMWVIGGLLGLLEVIVFGLLWWAFNKIDTQSTTIGKLAGEIDTLKQKNVADEWLTDAVATLNTEFGKFGVELSHLVRTCERIETNTSERADALSRTIGDLAVRHQELAITVGSMKKPSS